MYKFLTQDMRVHVVTSVMQFGIFSGAAITFVEAADMGIKIISALVALALAFPTYQRLKRENEGRRLENEIKKREIVRMDREEFKAIQKYKNENNPARPEDGG